MNATESYRPKAHENESLGLEGAYREAKTTGIEEKIKKSRVGKYLANLIDTLYNTAKPEKHESESPDLEETYRDVKTGVMGNIAKKAGGVAAAALLLYSTAANALTISIDKMIKKENGYKEIEYVITPSSNELLGWLSWDIYLSPDNIISTNAPMHKYADNNIVVGFDNKMQYILNIKDINKNTGFLNTEYIGIVYDTDRGIQNLSGNILSLQPVIVPYNAVSEPATLGLFGLGLIFFGARITSKRKK